MKNVILIHGHFYQPPRENPWTDIVDRELSAAPFHDWNERVHFECYRPNGYARIVDSYGRVERIINNYSNISFNFGPTLLSWLERHHPKNYQRILEADRESLKKRNGHGNAIAQGYNHTILPLCNDRDRLTQVRWGMADFHYRFKRDAESLWLPETACNDAVLGTLIDEGLKYVILSPYQAGRARGLSGGAWIDVSNGKIDPSIPYRYFHRDNSKRYIDIFFYDGPLARSIAFEGALASSQALVDRFTRAGDGVGRLVNVATDGESYGHHFHFGDRCLAYALEVEAPARGFSITNYGEFLATFPPAHEIEINTGPNGEGTSWSCAHGVGRWYRDCGCHSGAREGWNQKWRTPLRESLDFLRDDATHEFELTTGDLFTDPWAARDAYIDLILDPTRSRKEFIEKHAPRSLNPREQARALTFLEIERHSMLMFTSCGWFFADISGIETVQVMKYAGRLLDLTHKLGLKSPRDKFLEILSKGQSNIAEMGNGADLFHRLVEPCRTSTRGIAAHLALAAMVDETPQQGELAGFRFEQVDFRKEEHGRVTLETGRLRMESIATSEKVDYAFVAMHLGGVDFYCVLKPFTNEEELQKSVNRLWENFPTSSLPTMLRLAQEEFGSEEYGLEHVLAEGRQQISKAVFGDLVNSLSDQYTRLYEDNQRTIDMLQEAGFDIPQELRAAAEFALVRRFEREIIEQQKNHNPAGYQKAIEIANEVARRGFQIEYGYTRQIFEDLITSAVDEAVNAPTDESMRLPELLLEIAGKLKIGVNLDQAQEIIHEAARTRDRDTCNKLSHLGIALGLAPGLFARPEVETKSKAS